MEINEFMAPMQMIVADQPPTEAEVVERHQRKQRLARLAQMVRDGHVSVWSDYVSVDTGVGDYVLLEIQGEQHHALRGSLPTEALLARLELAIAAGRSNNDGNSHLLLQHMRITAAVKT